MTDARERYRRRLAVGSNTERIEFFSDAVFAIAMTLLVLDIRIPEVDDGQLGDALVELIPNLFAYVLSFVIIAIQWVAHHRKFRAIVRYDARLVSINLLLLLLIAFLPFPTSLLSEYGAETPAVVLYAAVVALTSVVQYLLWAHARRARLFADFVDLGVYRLVRRNLLVNPTVFALSILIALAGAPLAAMLSWIAIAPASIIVGWYGNRRPDDLTPVGQPLPPGAPGAPGVE